VTDFRLLEALAVAEADLQKQRRHIRRDRVLLARHEAEARGSSRTIKLMAAQNARYDTPVLEPQEATQPSKGVLDTSFGKVLATISLVVPGLLPVLAAIDEGMKARDEDAG